MKLPIFVCLACLAANVATAQAPGAVLSSEGNWDLRKLDAGHDGGTCVLTPKTPSRVQVTRGRITVTGLPRNSIFNYQYRIDDGPALTPIFPSEGMQTEGAIRIEGDAPRDIVKGRRLRIRILDRWHEAISEDIDLSGLGTLYERLDETCR